MIDLSVNKSLVFWSTPGVEGEPFLFELIKKELTKGEKVVLFVTDKQPSVLLTEAESYGYKLKSDSLMIINLYDSILKKEGLEQLAKKVNSVLKKQVKAIVCFNQASVLIDQYGFEGLKLLKSINQLVVNFTAWPYEDELINELKESFESRVYINSLFIKDQLRRYYSINKDGSYKHHSFDLTNKGLIDLSNKVLVLGPEGAGKTSFIKSISERALMTHKLSHEFNIDYGVKDGLQFYGSSGGNSHELIDLLSDEMGNAVVVVDSSKPETFPKAKQLVNHLLMKGVNVMVDANNFTGKGLTIEELRKEMGLSRDIKIIESKSDSDKIALINNLI